MKMPTTIHITGLGHISALGQGISALQSGVSGAALPAIVPRNINTANGQVEILSYDCADVTLPSSVPEPVQRRMSRISKMCFAAVNEAVSDAFGGTRPDGTRLGISVGTAFGAFELANIFQKRIYEDGPMGASPSLFAGSVQNSIASALSMSFKIHGPSSTLMTMEQTTFGALAVACDWITQDVVDHAIVVIGDEISSYHSYTAAHLPLSRELRPHDNGFSAIVGEGASAFVLSRATAQVGRQPYAVISELALRADKPAPVEKTYIALCGFEGQSDLYKNWLSSRSAVSHAALYGTLLTGSAFEIAIAALDVAQTGSSVACVQITTHGEAQSLVLTKPV